MGTALLAGSSPGSAIRADGRSGSCCWGWHLGETPKYVHRRWGEVRLTRAAPWMGELAADVGAAWGL